MPKSARAGITSAELFRQADELRRQAETLRKKEFPGVVARIKDAIAIYGFTASDLGFGAKPANAVAREAGKGGNGVASRKARVAVKFRDRVGNTWSGRGPRPAWLKAALAGGATLESLRA